MAEHKVINSAEIDTKMRRGPEGEMPRGPVSPPIATKDFSANVDSPKNTYKSAELNDAMGAIGRMISEAAKQNKTDISDVQKEITEIKSRSAIALHPSDTVLPAHSQGGALFAMRYRNDTGRGSTSNPRYDPSGIPDPLNPVHRFEYIAKSSSYRPEQTGDTTGVNYFWEDSLWTAVPNGDVVIE